MLVAASGPSAVARLSRRAHTITRPASGPIVGTTTFTLARDHVLGPQAVAERDQDRVAPRQACDSEYSHALTACSGLIAN